MSGCFFIADLVTFAEVLDFVLNLITASALILTSLSFVYLACGRFPQGLKVVFGACHMPFVVRMQAVWRCRHSREMQQRFFEYMVIRSAGVVLARHEWMLLASDFAAWQMRSESSDLMLEVPNCTYLTSSEFTELLERYFGYLAKPDVADFYGVFGQEDFWKTPVLIREAYVMPAVLLSGLLARYDENWSTFISRYVRTLAAEHSETILTNEIYNVFAWLLWGPSREIDWDKGWAGLCQISYGDESNSVTAFANYDASVLSSLQKIFRARTEEKRFGVLGQAVVRVFPKRRFVASRDLSARSECRYFVQRFMDRDDESFAVRIDSFEALSDTRHSSYYCTAYIWLLFELDDGIDRDFDPSLAVAFFEHANLSDSATCVSLTEALISKTVSHFRAISENPETAQRRYRFVCGMNRVIEKICHERIAREISCGGTFGSWLADHVNLKSRHDVADVFESIDSFFSDADVDISFADVRLEDRGEVANLAVFYSGMFTDAFPNDDERESLPNILKYMKESRDTPDWRYHVVLAKDARGITHGGLVFDYFAKTNSVVIEFAVVDPSCRSQGLGTKLVQAALRIAAKDAQRLARRKTVDCVFLEAESPQLCSEANPRHILFWRRNGFRRLGFDYVQPSLGAGLAPVEGLWFLARPIDDSVQEIDAEVVVSVLQDYVSYAMGRDPRSDKRCMRMFRELDRLVKVPLMSLDAC